jgi:hypothetical protein
MSAYDPKRTLIVTSLSAALVCQNSFQQHGVVENSVWDDMYYFVSGAHHTRYVIRWG